MGSNGNVRETEKFLNNNFRKSPKHKTRSQHQTQRQNEVSVYENSKEQELQPETANGVDDSFSVRDTDKKPSYEYKVEISWRSTIMISTVHLLGLYGGYLTVTGQIYFHTFFVAWIFGMFSALGTTAGAHRYWAHKTYKAKLPLQILLAYFQTVAVQNHIYEWVRDHRVHHKYTETNADPHNAKRGFFFAHCGWLMCRKHEDVKTKGKNIDMSDLERDPVVMFQKKHYHLLYTVFSFVIPTLIKWYLGECLSTAFALTMLRYTLSLNFTWLVNSAAHLWGPRPYDKDINPAENLWVSVLAGGEGAHNYHHVFPWDYKASEFGFYRFNLTTLFIDVMAYIGWAYGLKTVPRKIVKMRMARTGDGSESKH